MDTLGEKVMVFCYWNGCIKHGSDGIYYEGSTSKKIRVERKSKLSRLVDGLYLITGLDKTKSKFEVFGRYPVVVSPRQFTYVHLPVVNDASLETMLGVPSNHPSINIVELYLEVKPTSDESSPLKNPSSSLKRQRTQQEEMPASDLGSDVCLNKVIDSGVSKASLGSSLWLEDDEMRVGLCFKDRDELKKAVDWSSFKRERNCLLKETEKDVYRFECVRWKCKWSVCAARKEEHGLVEITKYTGPHTCSQSDFEGEFLADEIERVVKVNPTISVSELNKWWKEKIGYDVETSKMQDAKIQVMSRLFGDSDESFIVIPKLLSALQSSNGLLVDWRYDTFPNPEFASFHSVFWAFPQSIKGFQHCRPLIVVDTRFLYGKYPLKLMIASGVDAANKYFPIAYAFTQEVSIDSWRWFLNRIREKVTQRKGLCLISGLHQDILSVINEPGSLWAYHRFCLNHLCYEFNVVFRDKNLKILVEQAGSTSRKKEFDSYMKEIEEKNPEARKWLDKYPPHQWAMVHDSGRRYGIMKIDTTSLFAVFQSARKNILSMTEGVVLLLDELRNAFDESFGSSRGLVNCGYAYSKPVTDKLKEFRKTSVTCVVITPLDRDVFQVARPTEKEEWIVHLKDSTCTCGEFQAFKFPCLHAYAVCDKLKINPLQYVDDCYTVERYYETYSAKFNPVPEISAWPQVSGVPRLLPPRPSKN